MTLIAHRSPVPPTVSRILSVLHTPNLTAAGQTSSWPSLCQTRLQRMGSPTTSRTAKLHLFKWKSDKWINSMTYSKSNTVQVQQYKKDRPRLTLPEETRTPDCQQSTKFCIQVQPVTSAHGREQMTWHQMTGGCARYTVGTAGLDWEHIVSVYRKTEALTFPL